MVVNLHLKIICITIKQLILSLQPASPSQQMTVPALSLFIHPAILELYIILPPFYSRRYNPSCWVCLHVIATTQATLQHHLHSGLTISLGWSLCLLHCCCSLKISSKVFGSYILHFCPNLAPFPIHPCVCPVLLWKKKFSRSNCAAQISRSSIRAWLTYQKIHSQRKLIPAFLTLTIANGSTTRDETVCLSEGGLCGNKVPLFYGSGIPLFESVTWSSRRSTVAVLDCVKSLKCLWYLYPVEVRHIHYKTNIKWPPDIDWLMFPGKQDIPWPTTALESLPQSRSVSKIGLLFLWYPNQFPDSHRPGR